MKEKVKSAILAVLVAASLIQSFILAYGSPKLDAFIPTEYVPTELFGTQSELDELVTPESIVLHRGGDKHTLLTAQGTQGLFYRMIYNDFLQLRQFENFQKADPFDADLDWEEVRGLYPGIEVRYRDGVPFSVLQSQLQVKNETGMANEFINRIWVYAVESEDEVRAFFFSDVSRTVYKAKADIDVAKVLQNVNFGEILPTYHTLDGTYYLPDAPLQKAKKTIPYTQFGVDQWKQSLFVDPGIARFLQERDGSQIYTDAKRGLHFKSDKKWLTYSDPVPVSAESKINPRDTLLSAVQFVNQHGGWNGSYLVDQFSPKQGVGPHTVEFRQYVGDMPVIQTKDEWLGYIKLVLQRGIVSHYERSLINLDVKGSTDRMVLLPGGQELDDMLGRYAKRLQVVDVFPAYQPVIADKTVELIPRWAVELRDGTYDFL